jgi:hypothetical protein
MDKKSRTPIEQLYSEIASAKAVCDNPERLWVYDAILLSIDKKYFNIEKEHCIKIQKEKVDLIINFLESKYN